MRVLVTGGAGFIGSHTSLRLLESGHDVAVLDNFQNSSLEPLRRIEEFTRRPLVVHECDVRSPETFDRFVRGWRPDSIVHFAGLKSVSESVQEPERYYTTNVQGTVNVARIGCEVGVRRFVFSSSATVYGAQESMPVDEGSTTAPVNPYGYSKLFAEQVLQDVKRAHPDFSLAVLRYFNPVGAHPAGLLGEDPAGVPANLMPYMARVAAGQYPHLQVFGDDYPTPDGTGVRDFIHVMDLADAHLAALDALTERTGSFTWNVGSGAGISVMEMVSAFERATGRKIPIKIAERRVGDIPESYANVGSIGQATGWHARRGVEDMVRDLWRWQTKNPMGYRKNVPDITGD